MSLSQLALEIKESPTLALNEKARILKEKGEAVIHLGAGEPKSKVPIDAILSSAAKLTTAEIRYTPTEGIPQLLKAIVRYTEESYNKLVGPENIIVASGAKQAFYNLMMTLLNPQDEVVILAPYWVSYPEIVKMLYGKPVIVAPEDGRFHPRMKDITQAVSGYTKAIVVNSPNNPSGVVYSEDFIREIVEYCEKKSIYLIMDDIYHKLVFEGKTAPPAYKFAKDESDASRLITINGVSKLYAMTGFRIGWGWPTPRSSRPASTWPRRTPPVRRW
jgi:aspartate aminotransferase